MKRETPSRDAIALLPPFEGLPLDRVFVPASERDFADACDAIRAAGVVGFDTESKPTFDVGQVSDGPHVVQFATLDAAYLFQVHRPECREPLLDLLASPAVEKVGFGLSSDRKHVRARFGVELASVVDLNDVFRRAGYRGSIGVRGAVAVVFGARFLKSKRVTTSNWALPKLDARQMLYAANDAWAALRVHHAIVAGTGIAPLADDGSAS